MRVHKIKTLPQYFQPLCEGIKTLELRLNDRDYQVGDFLYSCEWSPNAQAFTKRTCILEVTHIVDAAEGSWLVPGNVAMSVAHPGNYNVRKVIEHLESTGELLPTAM